MTHYLKCPLIFTAIGLLLLLAGGISALASLFSVPLVLMVLGISGLLGSWMSARLQPV